MDRKNKCIFLDRDGVLNVDRPNYSYQLDHFKIIEGVPEALKQLKSAGFVLIVVTNQSGIAQGIYTQKDMEVCHNFLQEQCGGVIDHFYFSPYHPTITESLGRKPGTLMFEKAIPRFSIDVATSWMVGDRGRDLIPARALGMKTIQIGDDVEPEHRGDHIFNNLPEAVKFILKK